MKFQFHKGAIRTEESVPATLTVIYFNSIKVRLEREHYSSPATPSRFQFHKGAIRTALQAKVLP